MNDQWPPCWLSDENTGFSPRKEPAWQAGLWWVVPSVAGSILQLPQVPKHSIPAAPLRGMVTAWQWLHFKLGLPEPLFSPHELNKLTISHVVNSDAVKRDFGYQPVKSVADAMAESIEYYRAQSENIR